MGITGLIGLNNSAAAMPTVENPTITVPLQKIRQQVFAKRCRKSRSSHIFICLQICFSACHTQYVCWLHLDGTCRKWWMRDRGAEAKTSERLKGVVSSLWCGKWKVRSKTSRLQNVNCWGGTENKFFPQKCVFFILMLLLDCNVLQGRKTVKSCCTLNRQRLITWDFTLLKKENRQTDNEIIQINKQMVNKRGGWFISLCAQNTASWSVQSLLQPWGHFYKGKEAKQTTFL